MKYSTHRFRVRRPEAYTQAVRDDDSIASRRDRGATRHAGAACDWCRRSKKRCSKSFPECSQCLESGKRCSYAQSASSVQVLEARIDLLTTYMRERLGAEDGEFNKILATITSTPETPLAETEASAPNSASPYLNDSLQNEHSQLGRGSNEAQLGSRPAVGRYVQYVGAVHSRPSAKQSLENGHTLPISQSGNNDLHDLSLASDYLTCIDAYFRHVHRAYPFVNEEATRHMLSSMDLYSLQGSDSNSMVGVDSFFFFNQEMLSRLSN